MDISTQAELNRVYQPLFDIAHSIVLRWDNQGNIKYVNEYGAHFFGYQPFELIGKNVMTIVPEVDTRGIDMSNLVKDILENPEKYINHVNENVRRNGEIVHVAWTNKAIMNGNNTAEEVVAIGNDITNQIWTSKELLKVNQELALKNQKLMANNDLIKNLLYIAAHDLKGPIGNFKLIFDLIDLDSEQAEIMELLPRIRNTYLQLDKVINGLNHILHIQNIEHHSKLIDLEIVLIELLDNEFSQAKQEFGCFVTYDFSAVGKIVYIELFLVSILKNLISNAIKYRKANNSPSIHIKSEKSDDYVLITIEDQGIGIDLELHGQQLFTPFKRFTKQADGSGIGLYLIKDMISKNGGDVKIKSTVGKGTKIFCYIKEYQ